MTPDELRARAAALGVETTYADTRGIEHDADPEVLRRVVAVLEDDRASAAGRAVPAVHVVPGGAPAPAGQHAAEAPRPSWRVDTATRITDVRLVVDGTAVDVDVVAGDAGDSIELPHDLPVGCHDLEVSGQRPGECVVVVPPRSFPRSRALAGRGALFVPTYALWTDDDPLPGFHHLAALAAELPAHGVDVVSTLPLYAAFLDDGIHDPSPYSPVSRLHWNEVYVDDAVLPATPVPTLGENVDWAVLARRRRRQLVVATSRLDARLQGELTAFAAAHPDVGSFARFMAERPGADGGTGAPRAAVERSHVLAQYLADRQLGLISGGEGAALSLDLPIGSHPSGWETWTEPALFAPDMSIGAPPDDFFTDGQSWGFPPQLPTAGHLSGHRLWRQLVERAARHTDLLRIDHALALHRLWWVPDGFSADRGVYVRSRREELLAVIAATAAAAGVTIVGEDLGTVPPEVREAFERWDLLGMYEEQFHLDDEPLPTVAPRMVAGIRTHDMEAFAALAATTDLTTYRRQVLGAAGASGDGAGDLLDAAIDRLARSDAYVVTVDVDDLIGETRPHNLPGRVVPGLWQRRLDRPADTLFDDADVRRRLAILGRTT